jgi:serine protease Do
VDGASDVTVQLSNGRDFPGKVLGRDPKTDVAVIKIQGGGHFQPVQWGDSDTIRVGDSVFAVGSPFGLGNTVTAGILSARGREIGAGPYDDFLQVDAAINSGNSGGPLFDASGRVVGINTAIFSPSGGSVGIGFAIPSDMARRVAEQIVDHGSIQRGRIGVTLETLTPEVAEHLGMKVSSGALIAGVEQDGPAAAAGLESGDVIKSFGGKPTNDSRALARAVADATVGSHVPVTVLRDGHTLSFSLPIASDAEKRS